MFHNYSLDKRAVPMAHVRGLARTIERHGYEPATLLKGTGLTLDELENDEQRVTYRTRIRQLENMIRLVDEQGFWLDWPAEVSISDFGLLGYAMMSSATLEQAVHIAVKYQKMAGAMFELTFTRDKDEAVLRLDHLLAGGEVGRYVVEELFKEITPLIGILISKYEGPTAIHLNYPAPLPPEKYERAYDCPVLFEQPWCEYRFDARLLGRPLAEADSSTARTCEESCRKLLNQMEIEEDIVSRICHLLLSKPGDFPKLDVIANRLCIGTRTLRRRLKALGTSYQKILDDVKKELAIEYLQTTNLSVQEISELLGYSEVTNFRRAFVKWAGISPYQYRKQMKVRPQRESSRLASA